MALNVGGRFGQPVHYDALQAGLSLGDPNNDAHPEAVLTNASLGGQVEIWTNTGDRPRRRV